MNFSNIKQALEVKKKVDQMQKELAKIVIESDAGHGTVKVSMNGQQKLVSVKIAPEAIDASRIQRLEELIVKAVNDAVEKSQKAGAKQLSTMTGGLKIPGIM